MASKNKKAYAQVSTRKTSQSEPILGEAQVKNNAGGFVYQISPLKQLERFLILGSEGGTYYVSEAKLTRENAANTINAIESDGLRAVDLTVDVSDSGRAPKNDPAIFVLALAAAAKDPATRAYALSKLSKVCRIPTHLFHFLTYVRQFRGVGRGLKRALGNWYQDQDLGNLACQICKYQQRDGWSNRDLLRVSHPKTSDPVRNEVYKYIVGGLEATGYPKDPGLPSVILALEAAKVTVEAVKTGNTEDLIKLIRDYNLSREMVPTESLTSPGVWNVLLETMPMTAMIRNLGNMSKCGLIKPLSDASKLVVDRLHNLELLSKARVHPIDLLVAMKIYESGHGLKGKGEWLPDPQVVNALDDAFYLAFKTLKPTGKKILFGVDVSGSMAGQIANLPISCAEGAAAMALACAKLEQEFYIMGFTSGGGYNIRTDYDGFVDLGITPRMTLTEALTKTRNRKFGRTDCSLPMQWALREKVKVDCFVVITDNETWAGYIHPSQALQEYREKIGIDAKEVVIGMTATPFSIADPKDPRTLDVAGFDTTVPNVIGDFIRE